MSSQYGREGRAGGEDRDASEDLVGPPREDAAAEQDVGVASVGHQQRTLGEGGGRRERTESIVFVWRWVV